MPREIWKSIPGYEGEYAVSNLGRVKSLLRLVWGKSRYGLWFERSVPPRILKPGPSKSGHMSVSLGRSNSKQVHTLVLLAFRGPPPKGEESLHKNHRPADNRLTNLKYGTRSENIKMDYAAGTRRGWRPGDKYKNAKLTHRAVRYIRAHPEKSATQLALKYGVRRGAVWNVRTYKTWNA